MRSFFSRCTTIALVTAGAALNPFSPAAQAAPADRTGATAFALSAGGFGTELRGSQVPAGSGPTAHQVISCTNKAGISRENHEAALTVPGLGILRDVTTEVWTVSNGSVVSSYSSHTIGRLTLAETPIGTLDLRAIRSLSRAFHDASGYHSVTTTHLGSIILTPAEGDPMSFPAPTPDQPVTIPGVATISVGSAVKTQAGNGARASADAVAIKVLPTGTRARVAHTAAQIAGGVRSGIFSGSGSGTRVRGLADNLTSGPTPLQIMPCQGTSGVVRVRSIAHVDLTGDIAVHGLTTRQMGEQSATRASGIQVGTIKAINLNDGQLLVKQIVGIARAARTDHGLARSSKGTTVGEVLVDGEAQTFPDSDVLEIPGVARLERSIVTRLANGISVTALRITLLDGSGAVINLGQARLTIRDSGR